MNQINETIRHQLNHRTYREFDGQPVSEEIIHTLMDVVQRTATSNGMQQSSVIRVTDPEEKRALATVGGQEYVSRAPELWVFVADGRRNAQIYEEKTGKPSHLGMNVFFQAYVDAALCAQNVMCAIESMNLGGCFLGNVLNDAQQTRKILHLPDGVFPVLGIIFGAPAQQPELKPRMEMRFRFFENTYPSFHHLVEELQDYDAEMHTYYDLRQANRRVDTFTDQVVRHFEASSPKREKILSVVREAGYDLDPEEKRDASQGRPMCLGAALPEETPWMAFAHRTPGMIGEAQWRDNAVFVPWVNTSEGPAILFEVRSSALNSQPGEISFPGGAHEEGETFEQTAVRETCEELLLKPEQVEVFGPGDILIAPTSRRLDAYIGRLQDYHGTFSTDEVDHVFMIPYEELRRLKPEVYHNRVEMQVDPAFPEAEVAHGDDRYAWHGGSYRILIYRWKDYLIWGMTARILESALQLIEEYQLEPRLSDPMAKPKTRGK